jgi:NAD+ synthase
MASPQKLGPSVLDLDPAAETDFICTRMREIVGSQLKRRGVVLGVSGGVDSSVCLALAARAFGSNKVLSLLMPERESSGASVELGKLVSEKVGVPYLIEDITAALEGLGCYRQRDEAIRKVFPDYADGWKCKVVIAGGAQGGVNFFKLVVRSPAGEMREQRVPHGPYLQILAAQNYKQRTRKTVEFFHADRLNYAVIGTPNRLEYDQGFFVKNGDGSADLKPIAHLYKTQVYALARYLDLPEEICSARPTTDTYSLAQGQDEFYFALPYEKMDVALWAHNHGFGSDAVAEALGVTPEQAAFVYADIQAKRDTTRPLHSRAILIRSVEEIRPFS